MNLERVAAGFPLLVLLALPGWSVGKMAAGLRRWRWRTSVWFGHAAWASFPLTVLAWTAV